MARDLGTKYVCFKCGTKFYDLKKPVPTCPKCGSDQRDAPAAKPAQTARQARAAAKEAEEAAETPATEEAKVFVVFVPGPTTGVAPHGAQPKKLRGLRGFAVDLKLGLARRRVRRGSS